MCFYNISPYKAMTDSECVLIYTRVCRIAIRDIERSSTQFFDNVLIYNPTFYWRQPTNSHDFIFRYAIESRARIINRHTRYIYIIYDIAFCVITQLIESFKLYSCHYINYSLFD